MRGEERGNRERNPPSRTLDKFSVGRQNFASSSSSPPCTPRFKRHQSNSRNTNHLPQPTRPIHPLLPNRTRDPAPLRLRHMDPIQEYPSDQPRLGVLVRLDLRGCLLLRLGSRGRGCAGKLTRGRSLSVRRRRGRGRPTRDRLLLRRRRRAPRRRSAHTNLGRAVHKTPVPAPPTHAQIILKLRPILRLPALHPRTAPIHLRRSTRGVRPGVGGVEHERRRGGARALPGEAGAARRGAACGRGAAAVVPSVEPLVGVIPLGLVRGRGAPRLGVVVPLLTLWGGERCSCEPGRGRGAEGCEVRDARYRGRRLVRERIELGLGLSAVHPVVDVGVGRRRGDAEGVCAPAAPGAARGGVVDGGAWGEAFGGRLVLLGGRGGV